MSKDEKAILRKVLPTRIHLLDQYDFLFAAPVFDLIFAADGYFNFLLAFVINEAVALVFLCEAFDRVIFVLMNTFIEKAGKANIKCAGLAGENVDPEFVMESVAHGGKIAHTDW